MPTIESEPDVVTGDVVIGPWLHYEFTMRGEMFLSSDMGRPADVVVWLVDPRVGRKWKVCAAKAAYTISDIVFTEPFIRDEYYSKMWQDTVVERLSPGLWRRMVAAQLIGAYMWASCTACKEVAC